MWRGRGDELLDEHGTIAERRLGLALAARQRLRHLVGAADGAHTATTAARGGLQHHRITEITRHRDGFLRRTQRRGTAGHHGNIQRLRQRSRFHFVAEQVDCSGLRPDERDAGGIAGSRERGVLGEKAVTRVHTIATGCHSGRNHRLYIEIGAHAVAAEGVRRGGNSRVQRQRVHRRIHGDGLHAQCRGGACNSNGNFAAVGDQYTFEQLCFLVKGSATSTPTEFDRQC